MEVDESNLVYYTGAYKNSQDSSPYQYLDFEDQHFVVWLQMESFPNFRKLWGKAVDILESGKKYTIEVENSKHLDSQIGLLKTSTLRNTQ